MLRSGELPPLAGGDVCAGRAISPEPLGERVLVDGPHRRGRRSHALGRRGLARRARFGASRTVKGIPLEATRSASRGRWPRKHRYEEVIELIQGRIASEGLGPGSRLPSNTDLALEAGVSLITVRRALDELERDGDIVRYQGVGTFVARGRILSEPIKRGELAQTLGVDRHAVTTKLVDLYEGRPSVVIAQTLRLDPDELVWSVVRLRFVEDHPRILERATL